MLMCLLTEHVAKSFRKLDCCPAANNSLLLHQTVSSIQSRFRAGARRTDPFMSFILQPPHPDDTPKQVDLTKMQPVIEQGKKDLQTEGSGLVEVAAIIYSR